MHDDDLFPEPYAEYDPDNFQTTRPPVRKQARQKTRFETLMEEEKLRSDKGDLKTTYRPSKFEAGWLLDSLKGFFDETLLTDILSLVRGGKEASVYCCTAHPSVGMEHIAAKVYRPRQFRNLRNDSMYREGRQVLTGDGRPVHATEHRILRAVGKKTEFGVQVAHSSWLLYEYTTLKALHAAGAAVPQPIAVAENAILMRYFGEPQHAAPTLSEVKLERDEAHALFAEVFRNIEILLMQGWIHGDLSAYNILYHDGDITLIDFPQVTRADSNQSAAFILRRDITRVCEYFQRQGVACDANRLTHDLWEKFVAVEEEREDAL